MNAVILIKPLDGLTAGHPQPSAACFQSKQDCLMQSYTHKHTHNSTQTKAAQTLNNPTHMHRSDCTSFFLAHGLIYEYFSHPPWHTYMHTHSDTLNLLAPTSP